MITTCWYDFKVWVIRGENGANIPGLCKLFQGFQICFWVHLKYSKYTLGWHISHLSCLWKLLKFQVGKVAEDNLLLEMVPDRVKLVPVGSAKRNFVSDQSPLSQIKVNKSNDPEGLVTLRALSPSPPSDILSGAKDDRVHGGFYFKSQQLAGGPLVMWSPQRQTTPPLAISGFRSKHANTRVQRVHTHHWNADWEQMFGSQRILNPLNYVLPFSTADNRQNTTPQQNLLSTVSF